MASTSQNTVCSPSSSKLCWRRTELRTLLTRRIIRSQTPPWCEPAGGLKLQRMPTCDIAPWILSWVKAARASFSSLSAQTKLVPLPDLRCSTCPLLLIKRRNALMHASVSSETATSRWMALLAIKVNITPYRLQVDLPLLTSTGPKNNRAAEFAKYWSKKICHNKANSAAQQATTAVSVSVCWLDYDLPPNCMWLS